MNIENIANEAYYNEEEPIITDQEFDLLSDDGLEIKNFRNKTDHFQPMGSLKKIKTEDEYIKFCNGSEIRRITPKLDGNSIEVVFHDGEIVKAITRGDGFIGNDVTDKIHHCSYNFQNHPENGSIKCEAIMKKEYQKDYDSNIRNVVAGILNRKSIQAEELAKIDIIAFDDLHDMNNSCGEWNIDELEVMFLYAKENYQYEIDGLVIELDEYIHEEKDPLLPANIVALKFNKEGIDAEVGSIEWNIGKHGRLTPVLILKEKIEIDDTIIGRVSASNFGIVRDAGLNVGAKVKVIKSGDIIPYISKVVEESLFILEVPVCPACSCVSHISKNGVHALCLNPYCKSIKLIKLQHIFRVFDLEYVSDSTIEKLFHFGFTTLNNFFDGKMEEINGLPGFGKRKATNIVSKLKSLKITEGQAMECAMVPGFGLRQCQKLIDHYGSLEKIHEDLMYGNEFDLTLIPGFGEKLNLNFKDYSIDFLEMITLLDNYDKIKKEIVTETEAKGNIVFTGKCEQYGRKELTKVLKDMGYNIQSGINKETNILLMEDINSDSSKAVKARKLGVKCISYNTFFN